MNPTPFLRPAGTRAAQVATVAGLVLATFAMPGCSKSPTRPPVPTPPTADFVASKLVGVVPFTVQFTNKSTNATSYHWDFGDGQSSSESNPSHSFNSFGRRTVTLTATSADGESSTTTTQIEADMVVMPFSGTSPPARRGPFYPIHTYGDCDFAGHGPDVWLDALAFASADHKTMVLRVHMKAKETVSDWTTAEGTWNDPVWTAPPDAVISSFEDDTELHYYHRDTGIALRTSPGNSLGAFTWLGDTSGDDVCGTTPDDTHCYFTLSQGLRVRLKPL